MSTKFRITTAWCRQARETPWMIDAYDEIAYDEWGGTTPDHFKKQVDEAIKDGAEVRIVDLVVDYSVIEERFSAASVEAEIEAGEAPGG